MQWCHGKPKFPPLLTSLHFVSDSQGIVQLVEDISAGHIDPAPAEVQRQVGEVVPGAVLELGHQSPHADHGGQLGVEEEQQGRHQDRLGHADHLGGREEGGEHGELGQVTGRQTGARQSWQRVCAF